jgi:hypothetical protein
MSMGVEIKARKIGFLFYFSRIFSQKQAKSASFWCCFSIVAEPRETQSKNKLATTIAKAVEG